MASARTDLVQRVTRFYLESADFNGCPASSVVQGDTSRNRARIRRLVAERRLDILTSSLELNPHIKRLGVPKVEKQLEALASASTLREICLYPHPDVLKNAVDVSLYAGSPFKLELALGASQLSTHAFDLTVLEFYRNDPRYTYSCDDIHGWISISDDYYESTEVPQRDQILLDTFGFAYNGRLERAVTTFVCYLAKLSPEHQQLWNAKRLGDEFKMHPDFFRTQILGDWPERLPIFTAFWMELEIVSAIATRMGRPPLFRNVKIRPKKFAFLVRPTLSEFNDFVLLLDKALSDNLNAKFFGDDLPLERESIRADGKIVVTSKGTLALLDEWLHSRFRTDDQAALKEMMATLREIRKLRQHPAHGLHSDIFDQKYFHEQRDLIVKAYTAVRTLRLIFENHPAARGIEVHPMLRDGKISSY
ncbi:MAG TPA: hypothetical protein VHV51_23770 [Polyangiaceae bacterium]|jgi:hypothetical protein|nr:hypothetical protein [Polyangiaceae bacterium]